MEVCLISSVLKMTKRGGGAYESAGRKVGGVDNELRMQVLCKTRLQSSDKDHSAACSTVSSYAHV